MKGRKAAANKNLPILSHEFVIQNHADIMSCVAMVIVIGLMVQVSERRRNYFLTSSFNVLVLFLYHVMCLFALQLTSPVSSLFVALQYVQTPGPNALQTYGTGLKDLFAIFFYFLICIIFHAIIQEYVLDVSIS